MIRSIRHKIVKEIKRRHVSATSNVLLMHIPKTDLKLHIKYVILRHYWKHIHEMNTNALKCNISNWWTEFCWMTIGVLYYWCFLIDINMCFQMKSKICNTIRGIKKNIIRYGEFFYSLSKKCLRLVKFVMHTNRLIMMITFFKCLNTEKLGESAAFAQAPWKYNLNYNA